MCSLLRSMRVRFAVRLVRVFGLNSSNLRRAVDGVSPPSRHFARDRQKTHNWPEGNLFLCSPDPWPENSTENSGGMLARLANSVQNASLALELDGRVALPTHNFEMTLSTIDQRLRGHGPGKKSTTLPLATRRPDS